MLHKITDKIITTFCILLSCLLFASCGGYDEQDVNIIAYLRINDLLESKYSDNAEDEITQSVAQELISSDDIFTTMMVMAAIEKEIDTLSMEDIEAEISETLWLYFADCYRASDIPSKAQNTETGTYYTISELKAMYPEYKEVELVEFKPMVLISRVNRENLNILGDDINLKTLYTLQSYKKQKMDADSEDK